MPVSRSRRFLAAALALILAGPLLPAAQKESAPPPKAPGVERERVSLVLIDVVVTDRKGRRVDDLQPGDFSLKVDGKDQPLESVELRLSRPVPPPAEPSPRPVAPVPAPVPPPAPALPGRHFLLFFDGLNSERGLRNEVVDAARKFLDQGLAPGDQVMVAGQARGLKIYRDFTSDPAEMRAGLDAVAADGEIRMAGENRTRFNAEQIQEEANVCPRCINGMAEAFVMQDRDRIKRTLGSLGALVAYLGPLEGRKDLIFLTDGFPSEPGAVYGIPDDTGIRGEIFGLAKEAASAQVAIHTLNTLGLPGLAPGQSSGRPISRSGTSGDPFGRVTLPSGPPIDEVMERASTHTLETFSENTGGIAIHGNNKFGAALASIEEGTRASYVVAYAPPGAPDGLYHSLKVSVRRRGVEVRARSGFIWLTDEQVREREILAAYLAPDLYQAIPIAVDARSFLNEAGKEEVEIAIAVPDQSVLLQPRDEHFLARLEAGATFQTAAGEVADRFSRATEVQIGRAEMASSRDLILLARRPLPPGEYEMVAVVRDLGTGNIGARKTRIRVQALPADRMSVSSLVLGSGEEGAVSIRLDPDPSPVAGLLVPDVRRVFPRTARIVGSCVVYHPRRQAATGEARLIVQAFIRKGDETVRQLPSAIRVFTADEKAEAIPVEFPFPLAGLGPGIYTLRVEALDQIGGKGIVQDLDFMVR